MKALSATAGEVFNGILTCQQDGCEVTIEVGSASWYRWLETATSFTFHSAQGTLTAHKERASNRRGGWYWRAYRQHHGRLFRFYLGVSSKLTLERLHTAAAQLQQTSHPTGEHRSSLPSAPASPILATKLQVPRLPVQHIPRPHIVALLEQSTRRPLTLISAPAGSGKTTLLAEWAATATMPLAWLALETADDDPARFLSYLLAALARLDQHINSKNSMHSTASIHSWEQALTHLINDLTGSLQQDAVLILDDFHLMTSDTIQAMLHFLLDHLPARLHLLIGTRVDPTVPLARLRARDQLSELRTDDLRFASSEVGAFAYAMGVTLSDEATSLLEQRTEGWIAGIQLLTLVLRGYADAAEFLRAFRGTHRFLLDYVIEEVLAQQMPDVQYFLLQTCILERMTGPLCDAVTAQTGSQARLSALLRANLFVSVLDDTETWYRYHPLFAEALLAHLSRQQPDLLPELYRRASLWYEQQQLGEEACEYAFLAADLSHAAALLAELVPNLIGQGKFMRLIQWLDRLPPPMIAASPQLYLASTWMQPLRTRAPIDMQSIVAHLQQQLQEHAEDAPAARVDLQRELTLQQAITALAQDDIPRTLSLARETLGTLPNLKTAWSRFIFVRQQMILSAAYRAKGDLEAAEQALLDASPSGDPLNLLATMTLGELYEAQGQLRKIGQLYDGLASELARNDSSSLFLALAQVRHYDGLSRSLAHGIPSSLFLALAQVRHAALLYEWNQLDEADAKAQQLLEVSRDLPLPLPIPIFAILSLWIRVRVLVAQGHTELARQQLTRKELDTTQWQISELRNIIGTISARLALACDQLELARSWEETCGLHFDDPLKVSLESNPYLNYVTLARILIACGRQERNASSLSQALLLLERLSTIAASMNFHGWFIELQMLTSLALQAQGKTKQALITLGPILAQAEPEGYVRLFADEGQPMSHLLTLVPPYTTASASYLHMLQTAIPLTQDTLPSSTSKAVSPHPQPLIDPLSMREQEVLRLLANGYTNQQIADHLVISLNTAKRHVKHILAKLTATNRTQAITRARELKLI